MYKTGALLVSNSTRLLVPSVAAACRLVTEVLYIPISVPRAEGGTASVPESVFVSSTAQQIENVYLQVSKSRPALDVRFVLPCWSAQQSPTLSQLGEPLQHSIEAVLSPATFVEDVKQSEEYRWLSQRVKRDKLDAATFRALEFRELESTGNEDGTVATNGLTRCWGDVALGGTFDNIHNGHRLLLTLSALQTTRRILVGLADGPLLASKVLPEIIKPVEERVLDVKCFLGDVKAGIEHDVVPITDVYGPTAWDDKLECLVVSPETARGADKVNAERERKGLRRLAVYSIPLITSDESEEGKLSSSDIRKAMLGVYRQLNVPRLSEWDPSDGPYLVGLTGGIASGKSSVFKRLQALGAFPVDCDKLGHEAYKPGMPAYSKLVEEFGHSIVSNNGEIDRKVLGSIVFSDKSKLQRLNAIVWPEIWRLAQEEIEQAKNDGYRVCVIDAAVMIRAGWDRLVHEVWVTTAPQAEVVVRVMRRDGLGEEEVRKRMGAQPTVQEYVSHANVVICTQWDYSVTQKQVEKAWKGLEGRMNTKTTKHRH
eukprot:Em0004g72a